MYYRILYLALIAAISSGCQPAASPEDEALRIATDSIIVDTHIDAPWKLILDWRDLSQPTDSRDFDAPRAKLGRLNAPFMSIYTNPKLEAEGRSREVAEQLIDAVEKMVATAPETFAIARSPSELRKQFAAGLISLPMGMENGSPIEGNLDNLRYFHERGVRYVSLAHSLSNHLADSSYDDDRKWNGLSAFGVEVVQEMNRLGMMVDVSHASDDAFWQIIELSQAPVIASHSSARHFIPDSERNMSDDMIRALAKNGGVMQINFGSPFIDQEARTYVAQFWPAAMAWSEKNPELSFLDISKHFTPQYTAEHGEPPVVSLDDVLDHFDHVVGLVGVDHVGIGSDFDGIEHFLPTGLRDVAAYPNLIRGLLERGYSEADIRKILGENLLRVWAEVEAAAAAIQAGPTT